MELQCVEGIQDWQADCVERCEGSIMDVERLSDSVKNEAGCLISAVEILYFVVKITLNMMEHHQCSSQSGHN